MLFHLGGGLLCGKKDLLPWYVQEDEGEVTERDRGKGSLASVKTLKTLLLFFVC